MLPPRRTRLTLEKKRDYTREQLIEELNRLNSPYSHATQSYATKTAIVDHYNRLDAQATSSQANPHKARTATYIKAQSTSTGLNFEALPNMYEMSISDPRVCVLHNYLN